MSRKGEAEMATNDPTPGLSEVLPHAHRFVEGMVPKADIMNPYPAWYGWALRVAFIAGHDLMATDRDRLLAELAKAQAFKSWVHDWLDNAGVPHDPEPEHTKEHGCRISGRMQWLLAHTVMSPPTT